MSRRAFTLIEVLVAIILVGVAVTGVLGGLRAVGKAEAAIKDGELLQRLGADKADEINATGQATSSGESGDFSDRGYADVEWSYTVEASGETNVDRITLETKKGDAVQTLRWLVYVRPTTVTQTQ